MRGCRGMGRIHGEYRPNGHSTRLGTGDSIDCMLDQTASVRLKVILIDDHDSARAALEKRLLEDGRVDVVASTAALPDALAAVDAERPHVALVDLRRRDGEGLYVIAQLAHLPDDRRPFVAVHTAFLDAEEWQRARQAGADDSILKQIGVNALLERLSASVRRRLPPERWPASG